MTIDDSYRRIPVWTRGDRLRKAREETGLTSHAFAAEIGVSQKTVSDAENDKRALRKILLNAWAMRTGVPAEWLETGKAPTSRTPGPGSELPRLDSNQQPSESSLPRSELRVRRDEAYVGRKRTAQQPPRPGGPTLPEAA